MNPIILSSSYGVNSRELGQPGSSGLGEATSLGEGKLWIQTC